MRAREIGAIETDQQSFAVIIPSSPDLKRFCLSHRARRDLKAAQHPALWMTPMG
jgi:hypothetical protein